MNEALERPFKHLLTFITQNILTAVVLTSLMFHATTGKLEFDEIRSYFAYRYSLAPLPLAIVFSTLFVAPLAIVQVVEKLISKRVTSPFTKFLLLLNSVVVVLLFLILQTGYEIQRDTFAIFVFLGSGFGYAFYFYIRSRSKSNRRSIHIADYLLLVPISAMLVHLITHPRILDTNTISILVMLTTPVAVFVFALVVNFFPILLRVFDLLGIVSTFCMINLLIWGLLSWTAAASVVDEYVTEGVYVWLHATPLLLGLLKEARPTISTRQHSVHRKLPVEERLLRFRLSTTVKVLPILAAAPWVFLNLYTATRNTFVDSKSDERSLLDIRKLEFLDIDKFTNVSDDVIVYPKLDSQFQIDLYGNLLDFNESSSTACEQYFATRKQRNWDFVLLESISREAGSYGYFDEPVDILDSPIWLEHFEEVESQILTVFEAWPDDFRFERVFLIENNHLRQLPMKNVDFIKINLAIAEHKLEQGDIDDSIRFFKFAIRSSISILQSGDLEIQFNRSHFNRIVNWTLRVIERKRLQNADAEKLLSVLTGGIESIRLGNEERSQTDRLRFLTVMAQNVGANFYFGIEQHPNDGVWIDRRAYVSEILRIINQPPGRVVFFNEIRRQQQLVPTLRMLTYPNDLEFTDQLRFLYMLPRQRGINIAQNDAAWSMVGIALKKERSPLESVDLDVQMLRVLQLLLRDLETRDLRLKWREINATLPANQFPLATDLLSGNPNFIGADVDRIRIELNEATIVVHLDATLKGKSWSLRIPQKSSPVDE
ncbi:MAG: hypothetical protein R3C03_14940 [Pirellulaceae bacterium]